MAPERWLGVLTFLVCVAFWPGILGAGMSPRWALMAAVLPLMLRSVPVTTAHLAVLTLLSWSALTLTWSEMRWDGVGALAHLCILAAAFWIGSSLRSLRPVYIGVCCGIGVSGLIAVAQWFGFTGIYQVSSPAGLFINGNTLAEIAVLALIAAIAERMWWFIPVLAPAALLPMARGPVLALIVALALWTRHRLIIAAVACATAIGGAATMIVGWRMASVTERFDFWADTLSGVNLFGNGIGSFVGLYPHFATRINTLLIRPDHAHNDLLELAFELGAIGFFCIAACAVACLRGVGRTEKLVLVAFALEGCFGFPFHMPATAFVAALAAGHLCCERVPVRHRAAECRV